MDQSYEGAQSNVNSIAVKSGCTICTQKCYVALKWPLMLHFKHRMCCPQFVQLCPQKIISRVKVPLKCNSANKSALFPQAARCPFSILGRTLLLSSSSFGFFPSGVATADFQFPVAPIVCILLLHFNLSHVLFHHIHKPPFWPSPFPLSWQLHPQHPSPNIPIIFPQYMSIPPQSRLSCFLQTVPPVLSL